MHPSMCIWEYVYVGGLCEGWRCADREMVPQSGREWNEFSRSATHESHTAAWFHCRFGCWTTRAFIVCLLFLEKTKTPALVICKMVTATYCLWFLPHLRFQCSFKTHQYRILNLFCTRSNVLTNVFSLKKKDSRIFPFFHFSLRTK